MEAAAPSSSSSPRNSWQRAFHLGKQVTAFGLSPDGQKAAWSGLSSLIHYAGRVAIALLAGFLLNRYLGNWFTWMMPSATLFGALATGLLAIVALLGAFHLYTRSQTAFTTAYLHAQVESHRDLQGEESDEWLIARNYLRQALPIVQPPWAELKQVASEIDDFTGDDQALAQVTQLTTGTVLRTAIHIPMYGAIRVASVCLLVMAIPFFWTGAMTAVVLAHSFTVGYQIIYLFAKH